MIFREIVAVSSENHTKLINPLYGQSEEFLLTVEAGARLTHRPSNHCTLKSWHTTAKGGFLVKFVFFKTLRCPCGA
jgi:hypothetical protein